MEGDKVTIFTTNKFKYDGIEIGQDNFFYHFKDRDGVKKKIPLQNINLIGPRGQM